jgi:hypothetical protein
MAVACTLSFSTISGMAATSAADAGRGSSDDAPQLRGGVSMSVSQWCFFFFLSRIAFFFGLPVAQTSASTRL